MPFNSLRQRWLAHRRRHAPTHVSIHPPPPPPPLPPHLPINELRLGNTKNHNFCASCLAEINFIYKGNASPYGAARHPGVRESGLFPFSNAQSNDNCILCCLIAQVQITWSLDGHRPIQLLSDYNIPRPPDEWLQPIYMRNLTVLTPLPQQITLRNVRTNQFSSIDVNLVQTWLKTCLDQHAQSCGLIQQIGHERCEDGEIDQEAYTLILIDLQENCLVRAAPDERYLALSYVWGQGNYYRLTAAAMPTLLRKGMLKEIEAVIPRTIRDAMDFSRALGERFLWVDSICIPQDNEVEKQVQIANMAFIYSQAVLTLVAITATDANNALPGIQKGSRRTRCFYTTPELSLAVRVSSIAPLIHSSLYCTRAWTYQERLLSARCLYFTPEQAFFQCKQVTFCEDRTDDQGFGTYSDSIAADPLAVNNLGKPTTDTIEQMFRIYVRLIKDYTTKRLSFPLDILNAFEGIASRLAFTFDSRFKYGLPSRPHTRSLCIPSLLWVPVCPAAPRLPLFHSLDIVPDASRVAKCFPSWSWSALLSSIVWWSEPAQDLYPELESMRAEEVTSTVPEDRPCHIGCLILSAPFFPCDHIPLENSSSQAHRITILDKLGFACGTITLDTINGTTAQVLHSSDFALIALCDRSGKQRPEWGCDNGETTIVMVLMSAGEVWARIGLGEVDRAALGAMYWYQTDVHIV